MEAPTSQDLQERDQVLHPQGDPQRGKRLEISPSRRASALLPATYTCEAGHRTPVDALERFHAGGESWVRCPVCDAEEREADHTYRRRDPFA